MNPGYVYAATARCKRAFVMPCNGAVTMEGMPSRNLWGHLGGARRNSDATRFFPLRLQVEEKKQSADEKNNEAPQKPAVDEKPNEDGGFANRCIIDMYAATAFKRRGVYALG